MGRVLSEGTLLMVVDLRRTLIEHRDCAVVLAWTRHFYLGSSVDIFSLSLRERLDLARNMPISFLLEECALLLSLFQLKMVLKF
jgi:hypothetical protein